MSGINPFTPSFVGPRPSFKMKYWAYILVSAIVKKLGFKERVGDLRSSGIESSRMDAL